MSTKKSTENPNTIVLNARMNVRMMTGPLKWSNAPGTMIVIKIVSENMIVMYQNTIDTGTATMTNSPIDPLARLESAPDASEKAED
jgi:hypothetical protein